MIGWGIICCWRGRVETENDVGGVRAEVGGKSRLQIHYTQQMRQPLTCQLPERLIFPYPDCVYGTFLRQHSDVNYSEYSLSSFCLPQLTKYMLLIEHVRVMSKFIQSGGTLDMSAMEKLVVINLHPQDKLCYHLNMF